jgi:hypothetical protein
VHNAEAEDQVRGVQEEGYFGFDVVGLPIKEDEEDFNVPISKYFKLAKRSFHDFAVVQLKSVAQLQPLPANAFSQSNGESTGSPQEPVAERSPAKKMSEVKKTASQRKKLSSAETRKTSSSPSKGDDSAKLKVDHEQVKSGCSCHLL